MSAIEAYSTRLTTVGAAKFVKAIFSGTKVNFTSSLWGDGDGASYEPETSQTALKNLKLTAGVDNVEINSSNSNMLDVYMSLGSEVGGFTVREVGVTDQDGDLICVGCIPPMEKVVGTDLTANEVEVVLHIVVADSSVVTFTLSDSVRYLTEKDLTDHSTDADTHANLWIPGSFAATCATASGTATKAVSCSQALGIQPGSIIRVKYTYAHTSGTPYLSVNSFGSYPVATIGDESFIWDAGDEILYQFDGTSWVQLLNISEELRRRDETRYYGICNTDGATQTKSVKIDGFRLSSGVRAAIKFTYCNTNSASKLNISSTGAKPLYLNGKQAPTELFAAGAVLDVQYDGTNYNILGDLAAGSESQYGRVRLADEEDSTKTAANGYAASAAALMAYIKKSLLGEAGGVATLTADGKVPSVQLRGGWVCSEEEPDDTSLLWYKPNGTHLFYNGSKWIYAVPVWGE